MENQLVFGVFVFYNDTWLPVSVVKYKNIITESKHNLYQLWTYKDDFMGGVKTVKFTFQLNTTAVEFRYYTFKIIINI